MSVTIDGASFARRCKVTINSSEVNGTPTGFPIVIPRSKLPDEMFDSDGSYSTQSDGRDVRAAANNDATGRLAMFVDGWAIDADPANGTGTIYCANPGIASSGDVDIWIFYDSATATTPAVDSTYGQEAVFDAGVLNYYTMSVAATGNQTDKTGTGLDLTATGSPTSVDGQIGKAIEFNNGTTGQKYASTSTTGVNGNATLYADILVKRLDTSPSSSFESYLYITDTVSNDAALIMYHEDSPKEWKSYLQTSTTGYTYNTYNGLLDTSWHLMSARYDGSTHKLYVDGVERASASATGTIVGSNGLIHIGDGQSTNRSANCQIDDVMLGRLNCDPTCTHCTGPDSNQCLICVSGYLDQGSCITACPNSRPYVESYEVPFNLATHIVKECVAQCN